jgi:asparagine synthase (glutamine-hydrolysing)
MCGISGFINLPGKEALKASFLRIQSHRGPDSAATWEEGNTVLIHHRLSIIDPDERSNQPFIKDGLVIVFNGEIYNYRELQQKILEAAPGTEFRTTSDTEVLLELYRLEGGNCLESLIGMFAFAIYDQKTGQLFLARDHFGIKPLFYTARGNGFAFASELKTLVQIPGFDKTINQTSLVAAMNYLWVPGNDTMFNGCHKLPPAHYMIVDTAAAPVNPVVARYWQLKVPVQKEEEGEAISRIGKCLHDSIHRHMIADVPVSSFLSGGLDSSFISAIAREVNPGLSTYTIATGAGDKKVEQMPDDEKYARDLAARFGFDHHEIVVQPDILKDLPGMVYSLDEPIGDPAAINTWLICKAARERGVKVLLSGMGADEIFFGYRRQKATLIASRYKRIPGFFRSVIKAFAQALPVRVGGKGIRFTRWAKRFLSFAELPVEEAYMRSYSYYSGDELNELFRADISGDYARLRQQHAALFNAQYPDDPENQMCYTDIQMFMVGLNLTYTDRASMAASVEVRVPFIDRKVVEAAMSVDGHWKFRDGQSKYILKKVAESYLPKEIIYRPKASFGAPIRSWIGGPLRDLVDELLAENKVEKRGIFNYAYIKRLIDDDRKGIEDNAYRIYQLLTVELWFKTYLDGSLPN